MPEEVPLRTVATEPPRAAPRGRRAARVHARRIAGILLAAAVGIALFGVGAGRPAPEEGAPMPSVARPVGLDATAGTTPLPPTASATPSGAGVAEAAVRHGEDNDQPAGACWLARVGGAPPSCVCSAGTIETLLTPDYMRGLLVAWHDGGSLSAGELRGRLREVDAACGSREAAP